MVNLRVRKTVVKLYVEWLNIGLLRRRQRLTREATVDSGRGALLTREKFPVDSPVATFCHNAK